ncbi:hypothetical protein KKB10_05250 [Patescibacteria group bacterium]|nr:hypothetical protein [Patescibacteria group bacterium]MBU1075601.1 hypothetical protein [Patescibacteria group bacterium]
MKIPCNKVWYLLEKEDYANYLFVVITWEGLTKLPKLWKMVGVENTWAEYINSACNLFVPKDDFERTNKHNFDLLFSDQKSWDDLHKLNKQNADNLFVFDNKVKKLDPEKLSDKQLIAWVDKFQIGQANVHVPRGPMWLLETPDNLVTNYLHNYLSKQRHSRNLTASPQEAFQILITPLRRSNWTREKFDLARVALINDQINREKALAKHAKKYEWLEYGLQGSKLSLDYFKKEIKVMRRKGAVKTVNELRNELHGIVKKQQKLFKEYNIGRTHKKIFKIVQDSIFIRLYSKDSQFYGYYCMEGIFREIGRRTGLTLEQVRFLAPEDFKKALEGKNYSNITNERQKYSIHFAQGKETSIYVGKQAKKIRKKLKIYQQIITKESSEIIKGQAAYGGRVRGRVKIINTVPEIGKIHLGNILISHMTNPGIVPAMKQAAAIVTDLEGITSHAAIIARELKKPCLIGTKIATRIFKDGDLAEVDANKGFIKKL